MLTNVDFTMLVTSVHAIIGSGRLLTGFPYSKSVCTWHLKDKIKLFFFFFLQWKFILGKR